MRAVDVIIFLGVNVVLLMLLFVAFALLRGSSKARQGDKPEQGARSRATAGAVGNLDQPAATMSDPGTSNVLVTTNGNSTNGVDGSGHGRDGSTGNGAVDGVLSNGAVTNGAVTNGAVSNGNGSVSNGSVGNGVLENGGPESSGSNRGAPFEVFTFDADRKNGDHGNGDRNSGRSLAALTSSGSNADRPLDVSGDSELFAVDRPAAAQPGSSIYLDAYLEGNRSARDVLVGKVIDELTPLGLTAERLTPSRSRLRSADGRTVAVTARALTADEDRIEIVLDTSLAGQVFTALRQWHRVELDATDQMRLSARIR